MKGSVQVYIIHISVVSKKKKRKEKLRRKRRRREEGVKCQVANLSLRSRAKNFFVRRFIDGGRKLGCCQKRRGLDSRKISRAKRKKGRKGEIEERDEGVAKRLEPNWNST